MLLDKLSLLYFANSSWIPNILQKGNNNGVAYAGSSSDKSIWDKITPSKELAYHPCFEHMQCARLQVPLDWTDLNDSRTVELAVIRVPATVPITDPRYGGAVIINPGGPGGSGVLLALKAGQSIQTIISAGSDTASAESSKHFDIISFDPRGVNNTTPSFTCFPDYIKATTYGLENTATGLFDSSDASYDVLWAKIRAMASGCSKRSVDSGIGEFMTTASVSRDIIEIVERHGQWREKEARKALFPASLTGRWSKQSPLKTPEHVSIRDRVKYRPGEELVQYWGFSYGSLLGATLAAMFPERVSRVALDGVVDGFDYMKGEWLTNLQDTDMEIASFGELCWLGGPEHCALYHEDGPAVIVESFMSVVADLKKNPIGVPATADHAADVATYGDLKEFFWSTATYKPLTKFHRAAEVLLELSQGNGTGLLQARFDKIKDLGSGLSAQCKKDGPYSRSCYRETGEWNENAAIAIMCTDSTGHNNLTKEEYWEYAQGLMGQSRLLGDVWAKLRLPCTQWNVVPRWRYEGNFTAHTASPVLFVSNTVDNVTPIGNAITMSKGFEGSVVLQQDSIGHCSLSSPSFCTARNVREYFQTGKLPKKGTICTPDRLPLDGFSEEKEPVIPEGETDEKLWRAMVALAKH